MVELAAPCEDTDLVEQAPKGPLEPEVGTQGVVPVHSRLVDHSRMTDLRTGGRHLERDCWMMMVMKMKHRGAPNFHCWPLQKKNHPPPYSRLS